MFNEIKKLVVQNEKLFMKEFRGKADRTFELIADYLKAVRTVMEKVWGSNEKYKFTSSVYAESRDSRVVGSHAWTRTSSRSGARIQVRAPFEKLIAPWAQLQDEFRNEGFYERFPAKGQIERVRVIEQRLLRQMGA